MSFMSLKTLTNMIVTGIILLPSALPHAIQDLQDLKTTIDSASAIIAAAPNNASWGFFDPGAPAGTSVSSSGALHRYAYCIDAY